MERKQKIYVTNVVRRVFRMRNIRKLLFTLIFMMSVTAVYSYNLVKADTINITVSSEDGKITGVDIQDALDRAMEDSNNEYIITVPKGTYMLSRGLHIYSNTTLNLQGVVIKHPGTGIGAMIQVGYPRRETGKSTSKGGGYTAGKYSRGKNININGGTFDAGSNSVEDVSTLFTFSHVEKLKITGTKFVYKPNEWDNAHMIEFGAAKDVLIKKCEFIANGKVDEAIQIESARKGVSHSDLMGKEDGTPTINVKIEGCRFVNFIYGLGTNHGIDKDVYKGMVIKNNEFEKIEKYAICVYNFDAVISGNKIKGKKRSFESYILRLGKRNNLKLTNNFLK